MEEIKLKGVVIAAKDFKDSDKIVTIFSAEKGLISARVRGVKKNKAKLAFAVQPFAFVEFLLTARDDFYTVINATSIDQFFDLTTDFDKYILMLACLEICQKTMKAESSDPEMFLLLLNVLKSVCYDGSNAMIAFIKFVLESMNILGLKIQTKTCACCCGTLHKNIYNFSYEHNGLLCGRCSESEKALELSEGEFRILRTVDLTPVSEINTLVFDSHKDLVALISLLVKNFRILTDEEILTIKQFL